MLQCIIIDDELHAIKSLEWELNQQGQKIEIVNTFTKATEAIEFLKYNSVDLVFLDISMPNINGFDFLQHFKLRNFEVVFVTAFDEYAINAIKEQVLDYLLKPINDNDLQNVLLKVSYKIQSKKQQQTFTRIQKIPLPMAKSIVYVYPKDIIHCKSEGNYCHIYLRDGRKLFISKKIKYIEELLPTSLFMRVHNSYIVNLTDVLEFFKADDYVHLSNNKKVPVSKAKRIEFLSKI
ncbi:LytTR family DNA-binding domain-containing protein [Polaribacter sp. Z022]|uniref:LytR/AlgR family response regulator transcription factor n=1 Tax=Polaribacter sp. Z022 TaxID=2927125 RepID=UPI002021A9D2|nr:LytTR family DNA-binding domain-containing protein [Polaribacter sp. Z022]MCL7753726.1 LytTR family DNA-binding domain-containing protein [Polaribacter sp. Z022]